MKELNIIDKEIERLVDLKEVIKDMRDFAYDNSDVLICSESYFHKHLETPKEAGQVVFVINDKQAHYFGGLCRY